MMYNIMGQGQHRDIAGTIYTTSDQRRFGRLLQEVLDARNITEQQVVYYLSQGECR